MVSVRGAPSGHEKTPAGTGHHHSSVRPAAHAMQLYFTAAGLVSVNPSCARKGNWLASSASESTLFRPMQPCFRHPFDLPTIANRNRAEIEPLIGFFVNTLVLRTDLSGDPTFRELLQRVREVTLEAYAHQDLPFEKLVEELAPERSLAHAPVFQVMLALQNATNDERLVLPGLETVPLDIDAGVSQFDMTFFVGETPQGITGYVEYSTDLFDASTIDLESLATVRRLLDKARAAHQIDWRWVDCKPSVDHAGDADVPKGLRYQRHA